MDELIQALELNAASGNWYGALFVALSLPDICGKIDNPKDNSNKRYAAWFGKYVQHKYTHKVGRNLQPTVFLSGNDCYALRCSFLHEGSEDTSLQKAKEIVDRFNFIVAPEGCFIHCNMMNTKLQLQIDIFCQDIASGVCQWMSDISSDIQKLNKTKSLLKIQLSDENNGIAF